jgi:uncharacterized membrane protein YraQ (UPF0718 family)
MESVAADLRSGLILVAIGAWQQVLRMAPYAAGGIVLGALLGQFGLVPRWRGVRASGGPLRVLGAACLGAASPLPTYGTLPALLQLLQQGTSPGPVVAFAVASSTLNPQVWALTLGGLGPRLALAQLAGAMLISVGAGLAAARVSPSRFLRDPALPSDALPETPKGHFSWSRLSQDLLRLAGWIGFHFVAGVVVAAAIQVLVPAPWVAALLGREQWAGALLAGLLGVPFYTCGGAAVPILDRLLAAGMHPAAAVAYLLSGPATRITVLAVMGTLLKRRALVAYAVYVTVGAVIVGLLLG